MLLVSELIELFVTAILVLLLTPNSCDFESPLSPFLISIPQPVVCLQFSIVRHRKFREFYDLIKVSA